MNGQEQTSGFVDGAIVRVKMRNFVWVFDGYFTLGWASSGSAVFLALGFIWWHLEKNKRENAVYILQYDEGAHCRSAALIL